MRENESIVQVNRLLVVLCGILPLSMYEVELGAVVIDIGIIRILFDCSLNIRSSLVTITYIIVRSRFA